jgi:hypothetical protein
VDRYLHSPISLHGVQKGNFALILLGNLPRRSDSRVELTTHLKSIMKLRLTQLFISHYEFTTSSKTVKELYRLISAKAV